MLIRDQMLQLVPGMISGLILNYFVYDLPLTAQLSISSYALSIIVFMSGLIINACGNIGFSTESLCQLLEQKTTHSFQFYRTLFDVGYVDVVMGNMIGMMNRWMARFYVRSLQS